MSRVIYRQLIGREDFSLGQGKITQERGDRTIEISQIELEFIFRTVNEIRALDYNLYAHVALYQVGGLIHYYYDPASMAAHNGSTVIKPNTRLSTQPGRYLIVPAAVDFDTIIASASDEVTPLVADLGTPQTTFRAPFPLDLTNGYIRTSLTAAPTGAKLITDIHMNGSSMFSTLVSIDAGEDTSFTASVPAVLSTVNVPDDAKFEVYTTQVGTVYAGAGLKVAITGIKV